MCQPPDTFNILKILLFLSCNHFLNDGAVKNIENLLQKWMVEDVSLGVIDPVTVPGAIAFVTATICPIVFQWFYFDGYSLSKEGLRYLR